MPIIKSNTDLGNDYDSISNLCYTCGEPVFITKNGKGDLAVMSIEAYEEITARFELYTSLERGLKDIQEGNTRPLSEALSDLRWRRKK